MQEIWKVVEGYEGLYEVSNLGEIRSKHKVLAPRYRKGYRTVNLSKNGKVTTLSVHRLVAIAFIPNLENKPFINHIDGVKNNNKIDNLEWCTRSENAIHAYRTGLMSASSAALYRELNSNSKLTKEQILEIRKTHVSHCKENGTRALAKKYGVSESNIYYIISNKSWKDVI